MSERKSFEKALEADPCDTATRAVFADWLEERGLDDEAREQRRRATAEWIGARSKLIGIALEYADDSLSDDYGKPRLTLESLVEIGARCHAGPLEALMDAINQGELREAFWTTWSEYTGKKPTSPYAGESWYDELELEVPTISCSC